MLAANAFFTSNVDALLSAAVWSGFSENATAAAPALPVTNPPTTELVSSRDFEYV
jgi:hypothetical protein